MTIAWSSLICNALTTIWFFAIVLLKPKTNCLIIERLIYLKQERTGPVLGCSVYDSDAIIHVIDKVEECDDLTINLENCNLREEQINETINRCTC